MLSATPLIRKGEVVASYPEKSWKNYANDSIRNAKMEKVILREKLEKLRDPILMSLNLLNLANEGDAYASVLKERYCNNDPNEHRHPLNWNDEEIHELKGTSVFESIVKRSVFWRDVYDRLGMDSENDFLWSVSQVLTRAVSGKDRPFTFVPGLCCFNHSENPNAHIYYNEKNTFEVRASRDIDGIDEEITISYGENRSSANFLLQYGFVPSSPTKNDVTPPIVVRNQTLTLPLHGFEQTLEVLRRTLESSVGFRDEFKKACLSAIRSIEGTTEDDERILLNDDVTSSKRFAVMLRSRERSLLMKYYDGV